MKTAKVTLADATYYLAFDGEAMFTLRDDFGGTQLALEAIEQDLGIPPTSTSLKKNSFERDYRLSR